MALTRADVVGNEPIAAPTEDEAFLHPARPNGAILGPPSQMMTPESSALSALSSPHTIHRATIRSLTLPNDPNLDIPPSPLGSPIPGAEQKFAHFLELKKQGVHFNTKLASSSALKNPSLLPKLMDFAGLGSELEYITTLPTELWDPAGFPTWAYKEELAEAQHGLSKKREEERARLERGSIDFVAAGTPGQSSELPTSKGIRASAAERVMAGLGKDRNPSPQLNTIGVRNEVERRGQTSDGLHAGGRPKSPRRRKRSRSR